MLYEGVLSAIRGYQRKLGLDVEENFVVGDSRVWKSIGKGNLKDIYACLVANGDTLKCVDRWTKTLAVVTDTKYFFAKIFKTTNDTCLRYLRWFQYKMLYRLIPTGRFLFQRKLVDSPYCAFCKDAEQAILYMFWECPKSQLLIRGTRLATQIF